MHPKLVRTRDLKKQSASNTVAQNANEKKSTAQFVDNRPESVAQREMQESVMQNQSNGVVQRKNKVTVQNTTDDYSSGWIQCETQSTGVDSGPQKEAQEVAAIAGGSWVGGHMVNDRLGGGGGFDNIVPITSSMNNQHHTIENAAQNVVGNGGGKYEVNYHMKILHRDDYTFTPSGDQVFNLPDKFQQAYQWRTKEIQAGGSNSRPRPYQAPGPITTVKGKVLDWK